MGTPVKQLFLKNAFLELNHDFSFGLIGKYLHMASSVNDCGEAFGLDMLPLGMQKSGMRKACKPCLPQGVCTRLCVCHVCASVLTTRAEFGCDTLHSHGSAYHCIGAQ